MLVQTLLAGERTTLIGGGDLLEVVAARATPATRGTTAIMPAMLMKLAVASALALPVLALPSQAFADEPGIREPDYLTLRSEIGFGVSLAPHLVSLTTEAGYDGAAKQGAATFAAEGRIWRGFSLRASAELGGLNDNARPAIGGAYQLLDPRTDPVGLRVSVTYKPEGFTEGEGEIEDVAVVTRLIGNDSLRGFVAWGNDPEFAEEDGEIGGSYLHAFRSDFVAGVSARYRRGFGAHKATEPNWDTTAGLVAAYTFHPVRLEVFVGDETISRDGTHSGLLGLFGLGVEL